MPPVFNFSETFAKEIGSQYGIVAGSRENSLYNALWVAQALLRKGCATLVQILSYMFLSMNSFTEASYSGSGNNPVWNNCRSAKTADKRILLFTNEDDPFGKMKGATKTDMTRTTLQRAKVRQLFGSASMVSYIFLWSRLLYL